MKRFIITLAVDLFLLLPFAILFFVYYESIPAFFKGFIVGIIFQLGKLSSYILKTIEK